MRLNEQMVKGKTLTYLRRLLVPLLVISVFLLFHYRYHILYPGVSKVVISSSDGGVSRLTVPNEMISPYSNPPLFGNVGILYLTLETKEVKRASGIRLIPKYMLTLKSNGNDNAIWRITLPKRVAEMQEVRSDFPKYRKYIRPNPVGTSNFMLAGQRKDEEPVFIQCAHSQQISQINQKLKNCTYYGIYDKKLNYELMFPGEEIHDLENLIFYAKQNIAKLLDTE